jgi:hypothetical protein
MASIALTISHFDSKEMLLKAFMVFLNAKCIPFHSPLCYLKSSEGLVDLGIILLFSRLICTMRLDISINQARILMILMP